MSLLDRITESRAVNSRANRYGGRAPTDDELRDLYDEIGAALESAEMNYFDLIDRDWVGQKGDKVDDGQFAKDAAAIISSAASYIGSRGEAPEGVRLVAKDIIRAFDIEALDSHLHRPSLRRRILRRL